MAPYLAEIGLTPLLTPAEERELGRLIQERGDLEARDRLIAANTRLVVRIARDYAGRGLDLADLIGEGNLGLIRAADGFDPTRDFRFSTYAAFWIRQSIQRAVTAHGRDIRLPAYMVHLIARYGRLEAETRSRAGRPPTRDEVAQALNLSPKRMAQFHVGLRAWQLRRRAPGESEDAGKEADPLDAAVDRGPTSAELLIRAEEGDRLCEALDRLDEAELLVVAMRHGLFDSPVYDFAGIAAHIGLRGKSAASAIYDRAVAKLIGMLAFGDGTPPAQPEE